MQTNGDKSGTGRRAGRPVQRHTVAEAAEILGLTVEAVRGRIKRGKLEHAKEDGTVYVLLDTDQTATGQTGHQPVDDQPSDLSSAQAQLIEALQDQVTYMREQLAEEREARRRADTILAQLSQANAEQTRTIRAIEEAGDSATVERPPEGPVSPEVSPQPRDAPQTVTEDAGGAEPRPSAEEAQEAAQPRSWWRRFFGFE
jgi:hypothetical protein